MKLFNLRSFRILALGGAKASTYGFDIGEEEEAAHSYYPV